MTAVEPTRAVADDVQIVRRVLAHIDAGTTDEGEVWREPVENYLEPTRFADELRLLRTLPSVFIPSAAIPNPGDHVERVCFGTPLFAVRGNDGRARVFRNACRHRGMPLVEGRGALVRWCAVITAGLIVWMARLRMFPTQTLSRI